MEYLQSITGRNEYLCQIIAPNISVKYLDFNTGHNEYFMSNYYAKYLCAYDLLFIYGIPSYISSEYLNRYDMLSTRESNI